MIADNDNRQRFYGKYRGTVLNNVDPKQRGRLMITVPDVAGLTPATSAEACCPLSGAPGLPMGIYVVPPVESSVWVEFEQGDSDYPIWVGCLVGTGDVPGTAQSNCYPGCR